MIRLLTTLEREFVHVFIAVGDEVGTLKCIQARYKGSKMEEVAGVTRLQIPSNGSETTTILRGITLIRMEDVVSGSSEAMKACLPHIHPQSSVVVLPSNLCLEGGGVLGTMVQHLRDQRIRPICANQRRRRRVTQRQPTVCVTGMKQQRFV